MKKKQKERCTGRVWYGMEWNKKLIRPFSQLGSDDRKNRQRRGKDSNRALN